MKKFKRRSLAVLASSLVISIGLANSSQATDVFTQADIINISNDATTLSDSYTLKNDITFDNTVPISGYYIPGIRRHDFTGNFDGGNFTIFNTSAPLFKTIGDGSTLGGISNLNISTAPSGVIGAGILGINLSGNATLENVHVSGSINNSRDFGIGGLVSVALSGSTISNSTADVAISITTSGSVDAGGLVADGYGSIINSAATGSLQVNYNPSDKDLSQLGGLIGYASSAVINNSSSSFLIEINDNSMTGGLIGVTSDSTQINNSLASGSISTLATTDFPSNSGTLIGISNGSLVSNSVSNVDLLKPAASKVMLGQDFSSSISNSFQNKTPEASLNILNADSLKPAWAIDEKINSGKPYLISLIDSGFYTDTREKSTPAPERNYVRSNYREATPVVQEPTKADSSETKILKYTAGAEIKISVEDFTSIGFTGVTKANLPTLLKFLRGLNLTTLDSNLISKEIKRANALLKKASKKK